VQILSPLADSTTVSPFGPEDGSSVYDVSKHLPDNTASHNTCLYKCGVLENEVLTRR
jgi:hypothetical protein